MLLFFDMEFSGLHQKTTPISIGITPELIPDGDPLPYFYAEFTDYDRTQIDPWLEENVIANLKLNRNGISPYTERRKLANAFVPKPYKNIANSTGYITEVKGDTAYVVDQLKQWLDTVHEAYPSKIQMVSDCLAYDWVLFCEMFGSGMSLPEYMNYIPIDLCSLMVANNIDPDINRERFARLDADADKHNALWDAYVIRACFYNLIPLDHLVYKPYYGSHRYVWANEFED